MHVYLPTGQKNVQSRKGKTDKRYQNQLTNKINSRYTINKFLKYTTNISINANRKIRSIVQLCFTQTGLSASDQAINQLVIFIMA